MQGRCVGLDVCLSGPRHSAELSPRAKGTSPWERAALNLEVTFAGPLARSLALAS